MKKEDMIVSEAEKKRRAEYKLQRKKRILIQVIAILAVLVLTVASVITYFQLNKNFYISYRESSCVSYKVQLGQNEFYDEEYLEGGQSYVSQLLKNIDVTFNYCLDMESDSVKYDYVYSVVAALRIIDEATGNVIYAPMTELIPQTRLSRNSGGILKINESVTVSYEDFNSEANRFLNTYDISNYAKAELAVTFNVQVDSLCEDAEQANGNSYSTTFSIPLARPIAVTQIQSSAPNGESHVLACPSAVNANIFKVLAIVLGVIDVILLALLVIFVYLTRNNDINYTIKVRKIVSGYKSYIQQINNEFDREGYQILNVNTFIEMLDIRDTIQSPVLMYENEDKTRTEFLIPTNTKILYMFEIKVSDYDDIYAAQIAGQPVADEPVADEPVADEPVADEPVADEPVADERSETSAE